MASKLNLECVSWRQLCMGSLRGFATIKVLEMRISFREVALHERGRRSWAQLPSRPWQRDGQLVAGDDGKIRYQALFDFDDDRVRRAFSDACVRAVLDRYPSALQCREDVA
jgi:hypothetical protein